MRTWIRSAIDQICGDCGTLIKKGEPFQTIRVGRVKRHLKRCPLCASEPVPADVTDLPDKPEPLALRPFAEINAARIANLRTEEQDPRHWTDRD